MASVNEVCQSVLPSVAELSAVDGEVLEVDGETAIHATLLHASQGVLSNLLVWVDALVEAVESQPGVVGCSALVSASLLRGTHRLSKDAHSELVAHRRSCSYCFCYFLNDLIIEI